MERPGDVARGVLPGRIEVGVEHGHGTGRGGFGASAGKNVGEPGHRHEPLVACQPLEREAGIGRPGAEPAIEDAHVLDPVRRKMLHSARSPRHVATDDDVGSGGHARCVEHPAKVQPIARIEPLGGECDGARDVAATGVIALAPAVVGLDRPDVDDGKPRGAEPIPETCDGDGRGVSDGHRAASLTVARARDKPDCGG